MSMVVINLYDEFDDLLVSEECSIEMVPETPKGPTPDFPEPALQVVEIEITEKSIPVFDPNLVG